MNIAPMERVSTRRSLPQIAQIDPDKGSGGKASISIKCTERRLMGLLVLPANYPRASVIRVKTTAIEFCQEVRTSWRTLREESACNLELVSAFPKKPQRDFRHFPEFPPTLLR
jgi:hypothetical protein